MDMEIVASVFQCLTQILDKKRAIFVLSKCSLQTGQDICIDFQQFWVLSSILTWQATLGIGEYRLHS